jgi:hypothetical protein
MDDWISGMMVSMGSGGNFVGITLREKIKVDYFACSVGYHFWRFFGKLSSGFILTILDLSGRAWRVKKFFW